MAIKAAIQWSIDSIYDIVLIMTDSFSSVYVLDRAFPNNFIVKDIFSLVLDHSDKLFTLSWIKAHVGHVGNERTDSLAKEAIDLENSDNSMKIPFPRSILRLHGRNK